MINQPKNQSTLAAQTSEFLLYSTANGGIKVEVLLSDETIWLPQKRIAELFGVGVPAISKHLKNIFESGELRQEVVVSILENTTEHGAISGKTQTQQVKYYNLDTVISVGYRVNSSLATQFRIWATQTLKEHLVKGYTLNQKRLQERGVEFHQVIGLLSKTLGNQQMVNEAGEAVLSVISDYARSWSLLQGYDEQSLNTLVAKQLNMQALAPDDVLAAISQLKKTLIAKGEATELFGQLRGEGLASAID